MTPYHIAFVAVALYSTHLQVRGHAFRQVLDAVPGAPSVLEAEYDSLSRRRRVVAPLMGALTALLVALGSLRGEGPAPHMGILLTAVWIFAATGDVFIEASYTADDGPAKARYYIVGMALFVVVTLGLGLGLMLNALVVEGMSAAPALVAAGVSVALAVPAYFALEVSRENRGMVLMYSASVATLLCGGILSAIQGDPHLAYIGIAYFLSDWLVGVRDFGRRSLAWLRENALIPILILYYTIMLTSIDYAFSS